MPFLWAEQWLSKDEDALEALEKFRKKLEKANERYRILEARAKELQEKVEELETKTLNKLEALLKENEQLRQENEQLKKQLSVSTSEDGIVKHYQEQLQRLQTLVTLGKLIGGITHEINTPSGAINAATSSLQEQLPALLRQLPSLGTELDEETLQRFLELLNLVLEPREIKPLSSREERKLKRALRSALEEAKVENAASIASTLMKIRLSVDQLSQYLPLLQHEKASQLLQIIEQIAKVQTNLNNIGIATQKIMKMVQAVRNYLHQKSEDKMTSVDLKKNMEMVLTLYHNVLKYGIEVNKHYDDDVPEIEGYPDEISQIWTNLIHNAAQAMEGQGTLDIYIQKVDDNTVVVKVQDSGPGIPPEIKDRIFEPFFTTKPQGQGTGLGLDIVKKIVEKHRGRIEVESEPGRTVFSVYLPIKQSLAT